MSDPLCPCGCGKRLRRYNGRRELVCDALWRRVPQRTRSAIMLPAPVSEKRAAARIVYQMAKEIAADRALLESRILNHTGVFL